MTTTACHSGVPSHSHGQLNGLYFIVILLSKFYDSSSLNIPTGKRGLLQSMPPCIWAYAVIEKNILWFCLYVVVKLNNE